MRGPTRLIRSNVVGRLGRARPPAVRGVARGTYFVAALLMLLNVLAPMAGFQTAAAAPAAGVSALAKGTFAPHPGAPPPFPAPSRVAVVGEFQSAVGCNDNWDTTCSATELQSDGSGLWSGTFAIPSGRYAYRILVSSDQDRSLGQNGDPEGSDLSLNVPDGAVGVYFSYDQYTGQVVAAPVANQVELATDFGNYPMAPTSDGGFEVYVDAQRGAQFSAQVLFDGNPATDPVQITAGRSGRLHIVADGNGNITAADDVTPSTLTVTKTDENGSPLTGSCFTVYDARDNVLSQACDVDDGEDGVTTLSFPNGVNARRTTLAETFTPDGQATADDQRVSIEAGSNSVDVQVAGGGGGEQPTEVVEQPTEVVEQPTEAPTTYQYEFIAVDEQGNPLPGACYSIDGGEPQCDEDGDGTVTFDLTPGDHTFSETQAPDGYEGIPDTTFNAPEGGERYQITQTATAQPTEAAIVTTGTLQINKVDQDGNPLPGSCYTITPRSGTDGSEVNVCDSDDGSDDGSITVDGLAEGRWRVEESTVPDGYDGARAFNTTITAGETTTETVTNTAAAPETGNLTAYTVDDQGNPIGGVCYSISGQNGNDLGQNCDEDGDGDMALTDIPVDTYTVVQDSVPDGYELDPNPQTVEVGQGADARVDFTSPAKIETGALVVDVTDENGNSLEGACVAVNGPTQVEVCDNKDNDGDPGEGIIRFDDLPVGDYTVETTSLPEGYENPEPVTATVSAGQDETVTLTPLVPTPVVTPEPLGSVLIRKVDENGSRIEGSCFSLEGAQNYGPVCDQDENDGDSGSGRIRIDNVIAGDYTLTETTAPTGYTAADPQTITVTADETTRVTIENKAAAGSITVGTVDDGGNPIGAACYSLDGGDPSCDEDGDGTVTFSDVTAGDHTISQTSVPNGYASSDPTDQSITVTGGADSPLTFTVSQQPGAIQITKTDDAGNPLGGACFNVDGGDQVCDDDQNDGNTDAGVILISGVEPGTHTVSETQAPDGYEGTGDQQVDVAAGQTAEMTFTNSAKAGSIRITKTDEQGNPLGGACFSVDAGDQVCDNDNNDGNNDDGTVEIDGVPAGQHTVSETQAPAGYDVAADQQVEVPAAGTGELTFVDTAKPGTIRIIKTDKSGAPVAGACFAVDGGDEVCDNDRNDGSNDDGTIEIGGIAAGQHTVSETTAPDGYAAAGDQEVDVTAGETAEVTFSDERLPGAIEITKTDENGNPLPGACFTVNEGEPVCDNDNTDANPDDGTIRIENVAEGDVTVAESQAPDGYQIAEQQTVTVSAGETAKVTFTDEPVPTATPEPTEIPTETPTEIPTEVPTELPTETPTEVPTEIPTETPTEIPTELPTETPTEVPTEQPTEEATSTEIGVVFPTETTEAPTEAPTEEATAEPTAVEEFGSVQITKQDENGNVLGGACFALHGASDVGPVCDNDPADTNGDDGTIVIEGVHTGDYTLTETQAPDGFTVADDSQLTVRANETASVTVVDKAVPITTGNLRITSEDAEGKIAGGGCYQIDTRTVCDNGDGDGDNAPAKILIAGILTGDYTVTETQAPDGSQIADPQPATITANQTFEVTFTHEAAPVETGGLRLQMKDPEGNTAPGGCVTLVSDPNEGGQEYCDNGKGDDDPTEGSLLINGLPVGSYSITQSNVPGEASAQVTGSGVRGAFAPGWPRGVVNALNLATSPYEKTCTVQANIIIIVIIIIIIEPPHAGDLQIVKRAADTNLLQAGACFEVNGPSGTIELCDNDGFDASGTTGVIRFNDLNFGSYTVKETQAPPGYQKAANVTVNVNDSGVTSITIKDQPLGDTTGSLIVHKIDEQGVPLKGSCFELLDGNTVIAGPICDNDDGQNDGELTFKDIEKGSYTLRETTVPSADYDGAPDQPVTIIAGNDTKTIDVVNTLKPGNILITKTAEDGSTLLTGACFGLDRGAGVEFEACDQEASDGDGEEGIIYIANVPAGDWTLIETQPPDGYDPAADQDITVKPGETLNLIIKNNPTPPPAQTGTLVVNKVDGKGNPLAGACFSLLQSNVVKYSRCDNADGNADGTTTFTNVGTGTYKLHETKKPSNQYQQAPDSNVTITANQTKTVKVINILQNGRLVVRKTNQQGQLLQNGCFKITPDPNGAGELCTDTSGQVTFANLPTDKVYKVTESKAPNGYVKAADKTNITLSPGLTTTITFVDKKQQPAPSDGSVLVIKFYCPAGKSGPTTVTLDTSNPGPNKLAQTANCKKGGADFSIKPKSGGTGIVFNTGSDGQYQTTLKKGDYTLTEQSSGKQEIFSVYENQQTTIVVINYVAPPKPKPVTIKVTKYTCDPGFEAVYFADFMANCGDASQLTNGVTFRVSGEAVQKKTTGAGGQKGQVTFTQLPAGDYELSEDVPAGALTVYGFCGYDPNAPDWKVVGDTIDLTLGQGDIMTCTWFNVPDDLSDSTGAIVVHKYVCDIQGKIPTNFDWFANCDIYTDGAKFALSVKQGTKFVPSKTGITTADGLLRFGLLKPGTYQLKEVGANWCHAESDNVDAQGNVLVRAGERSNVWIFNCVKTNRPPNTGAGTTATPDATATISAPKPDNGMLLFGLAWPLFGAGLYGLRRRRGYRGYRRAA